MYNSISDELTWPDTAAVFISSSTSFLILPSPVKFTANLFLALELSWPWPEDVHTTVVIVMIVLCFFTASILLNVASQSLLKPNTMFLKERGHGIADIKGLNA